jgi:Ras family
MADERTVTQEEGKKFAGQFVNCGFMEASAKDRINIDEAFAAVVTRVIAKQEGTVDKKQSNCVLS